MPSKKPANTHKISAAGKKRIGDAQRKRWVAYRKAKAALKKTGKLVKRKKAA